MTNGELVDQFKRCELWNDAEQWEFLALMYYVRGYYLNAMHCFRRADTCRVSLTTEKDVMG